MGLSFSSAPLTGEDFRSAARKEDNQTLKKLCTSLQSNTSLVNEGDVTSGSTAIHYCTFYGNNECLHTLLVFCNALPNVRDSKEIAPIHLAALKGFDACLIELLEHAADPNIGDLHQVRPLHLAAMFGHHSSLVILLAHGADVNLVNEVGG